MNANAMPIPYTDARLTKREEVRYHRRRAAWTLASKLGDVTDSEYDKAYGLLNRCTRWAIAQQRHDKGETAYNWNKPWYVHEGELLLKRMERLNDELRKYGCVIANCGYFCQNVYDYDFERHVITNDFASHYLHFFD